MLRLLTLVFTAATAALAQSPQQLMLSSSILSEDRRILLRLPRHYDLDPNSRFPVLYKFDGDNLLDRFIQSVDILHSAHSIPDLIIVAIPNGRGMRNRDLTPATLHQDGNEQGLMGTGEMGRGDRFLNFLEQELIPYIDKNYRTTPERLLAGHSRGALLVLQSLLSKPSLFQARFLFSPPLMRDEKRMLSDTHAFLRQNKKLKTYIYYNWGEAENDGMNNSYNAIKELFTKHAPSGMRWKLERARAANHQLTPALAFPAALQNYFSGRPK